MAKGVITISKNPSSYKEATNVRKRSVVSATLKGACCAVKYSANADEEPVQIKPEPEKTTKLDPNIPKDNFYFVLIVMMVVGLVHSLPFSYFTTANEFWMYKFRNTSLDTADADKRTYLQINFSTLSSLCTNVPTVITNLLMAIFAHKIPAKTRVMSTLLLHTAIFSILVIFVKVNTDSYQEIFFVITVTIMMLVACSITFGAGGQYNLVTKLPPMYLKGYLFGEGIANLFNAIIRLISIFISPSPTGSAMIYFLTGTILLLGTTILTVFAMKTKFFRYYTSGFEGESKENIRNIDDLKYVLKRIWSMIFLNVFLMVVPMSSIYNLVVSEYYGDDGNVWGNQYFVTVCTFLIPAIMNLLGRAAYNKVDRDYPMPLQFLIVILYQVVFTTLIVLSNARPRHHLPVLLAHDWEYATAMGLYMFTKGFISNMTIIKSVKMVDSHRTELVILLMYFFVSIWISMFSPLGLIAVKML